MEEIGRAAGVGKGTLYRNFPSRDDLYAAVSVERFARLRERAAELSTAPDPWEALVAWLGEYDESARHYHGRRPARRSPATGGRQRAAADRAARHQGPPVTERRIRAGQEPSGASESDAV